MCVCVCVYIYIQLKSKVYLNRISKMLIILPRRIIQNACYCLFSTDLNNIFHIKDVLEKIIVEFIEMTPFKSLHTLNS